MAFRHKQWLFVPVALVGLSAAAIAPRTGAQGADDLVAVASKANPAAGELSMADARKMLLGETTSWKGGTKVVVVLPPQGSPLRTAILKKICGMTDAAYARYQVQAAFTGQTAAEVQEAASDAATLIILCSNPGAIGFIHKASIGSMVRQLLAIN